MEEGAETHTLLELSDYLEVEQVEGRGNVESSWKLMLLREVFMLGLLNFAYMVPAWYLADGGDLLPVYACLIFQFIFYLHANRHVVTIVLQMPTHPELVKRITGTLQRDATIFGLRCPGITTLRYLYLTGIFHFFDATLDSANAGTARHVFGPKEQRRYAMDIHGMPLVGEWLASFDLGIILTTLLVVVAMLQLLGFLRATIYTWQCVMSKAGLDYHYNYWIGLREMADASSLALIAKVADQANELLNEIRESEGRDLHEQIQWSKMLLHEFLEGLPSLHFGITLFIYTMKKSSWATLALNLFSTGSSLGVTAIALYSAVEAVRLSVRKKGWCGWALIFAFVMAVTAITIFESLIRLGMAPFCPDSVFSVLHFQCINFS